MTDLPLIIAVAAEDEGGSFLVSPNVGLMIWTLIVFGLSLWLLNKYAFPRIAEALGVVIIPAGIAIFLFEVGLVATLQAFIFATLTAIYLGGAVAEHH